jgi:hypothetical protein
MAALGLDTRVADAARIRAFHELLSTLAGALDVRDVFKRLSTVAARIILS